MDPSLSRRYLDAMGVTVWRLRGAPASAAEIDSGSPATYGVAERLPASTPPPFSEAVDKSIPKPIVADAAVPRW